MSEEQNLSSLVSNHFNKEAAAGINATFQLDLTDGEDFFLKISDGQFSMEKGQADNANVTMTTDEDTLKGIINGQINGMQAFMTGKLKFSGDMGLAMKLKDLFS